MPASFGAPPRAYGNGGIIGPPSFVGEGRNSADVVATNIATGSRGGSGGGRPIVKNYIVNDFDQALREGFNKNRDTITGIVTSDPRVGKKFRGR